MKWQSQTNFNPIDLSTLLAVCLSLVPGLRTDRPQDEVNPASINYERLQVLVSTRPRTWRVGTGPGGCHQWRAS
ncbi:hypothetical protein BC835DRAFT_1385987 [Cytidiella melzeri]|nr:hypothetical protein BC835DRAFT_1385987 [Cytidiella melzeri]